MSRSSELAVEQVERATSARPPRSGSRAGSQRTQSARSGRSGKGGGGSAQAQEEAPAVMETEQVMGDVEGGNDQEQNRIDRLAELAIGASDIKKMKDAGFHTLTSVMMKTKKQLMSVKGMSEPKIDKVRDAAMRLCGFGFISGVVARQKRDQIMKITTGCTQLDEVLGGGIETASLTEAYGEFRCGKTQMSHTFCVTAQLPRGDGGGDGRVAYIDTENTFRPERVAEIATRYDVDPDDVLDNIIVARAFTSEMQSELLEQVAAQMASARFSLLIVDSATALYRVDFMGRGELAERQQRLGRFMSGLIKIAEQFGVAVFLTNQVQAVPDSMSFGPDKKPVGGHVMAHASTTRLALRKGRGEQRICKVVDSPLMPEAEATFSIGPGGVMDPAD